MSPILIITYKRLDGLKGLVESLLLNDEAIYSDLWIAIDYCDDVTTNAIFNYAKSIIGFSKVNIISREKNIGMMENGWSAINQIFNVNKDYCIILEDDMVVSNIFLKYMNFYLKKYAKKDSIFAVCGYSGNSDDGKKLVNYPIISQHYVSWGVGLFKRAVVNPCLIYENDKNYYLNYFNWFRTHKVERKLFPLICLGYISNIIYPDVMFSHHVIKNNSFVIKPKFNLIINNGFDVHATNCKIEDNIQMNLSNANFIYCEPVCDELIDGQIGLSDFFYYILFIFYFLFGCRIATIVHSTLKKIYKFLRNVLR